MVRQLPQVLVYSNGAFGAPLGYPEDVGDLGEARIEGGLDQAVLLQAVRQQVGHRGLELEAGSDHAAQAAQGGVDADQAEQPGQPAPRQLGLGQVPGEEQDDGETDVGQAPVREREEPVGQRADHGAGCRQAQGGEPGRHHHQEHQPQAERRGDPDGAALPAPGTHPHQHRDGQDDDGKVAEPERPPDRVAGQQGGHGPGRVGREPPPAAAGRAPGARHRDPGPRVRPDGGGRASARGGQCHARQPPAGLIRVPAGASTIQVGPGAKSIGR